MCEDDPWVVHGGSVIFSALSGCGSGTGAIVTHNLGFKHGIASSRMYFTQQKHKICRYYHVKNIRSTTDAKYYDDHVEKMEYNRFTYTLSSKHT